MSDTTQPLDLDALKGFTPGPWCWVNPSDDTPRRTGQWSSSLRTVAHTCSFMEKPNSLPTWIVDAEELNDTNMEANATLIAAAPQLYAELVKAWKLAEDRLELVLKLCQEKLELHTALTEARKEIQELQAIREAWNANRERVFESMGNDNPRALAIDEASCGGAQ